MRSGNCSPSLPCLAGIDTLGADGFTGAASTRSPRSTACTTPPSVSATLPVSSIPGTVSSVSTATSTSKSSSALGGGAAGGGVWGAAAPGAAGMSDRRISASLFASNGFSK